MTRTFASAAACRASARDVSLPMSVPSESRTTVVRSRPLPSAIFAALTSASYMCVPTDVGGTWAADWLRASASVLKSVRTVSPGPNTTIATGKSPLRSARNARAAAIAFSIGLPSMLLDASIRRTAPLFDAPGGVTARLTTGLPFSVTSTWSAVSACVFGSPRRYVRSGKLEPDASLSVGFASCPSASAGRVRATRAAPATAMRATRLTRSRLGARRARRPAPRTGSAEARCRACGTSRGTPGAGPSGGGRP